MKKIVYHYCSNEVLLNILSKKQLWMCDITHSNDFKEMKMFFPGLFDAIEDFYPEQEFSFKYHGLKNKSAIKALLDDAYHYIRNVYNSGHLTSFVACFCENGNRLSQWRGYANDGKGCALGFSTKELSKYCDSTNGVINFTKVEYVDEKQLNEKIITIAKNVLPQIASLRDDSQKMFSNKKLEDDIIEASMFYLFTSQLEKILTDSLRFKWGAFKEEHEWRLFFGSITKDASVILGKNDKHAELIKKFDSASRLLEGNIEFREKDDVIEPYYPLRLDELSNCPIHELIIGPKNRSRIQDVRLLMAKYGLGDSRIELSNIPYC